VISGSATEHVFGGEGAFVLTAAAIADVVGGRVVGDPGATVGGVAALDRALPTELSFLARSKYATLFATSRAGVVLITPELADAPGQATTVRIIVDRPHEALLSLLPRFHRSAERVPGVHPSAVLGRGVELGRGVTIGAHVILGDGARIGDGAAIDAQCVIGAGVEIGAESRLLPSVTLYEGTRVGRRVTIHAGARIGSDGFGYVYRDGRHEKIPHVGRCIVEDDVEIGANTTIDRGSIDDTVIGAGTKIDNLVHIAHNVRIGRLCLIMAQVGIAGSARVEDGCILAGQVGVSGHHTIGKGATLAAQAGAFGDIPAGETWSGYPARPHKEALRAHAALFKLAPLFRRIERLLDGKSDGG
jgi:UDP-3-O-[3-hydroxymyristoyl] glucosamine N-acyltransferase